MLTAELSAPGSYIDSVTTDKIKRFITQLSLNVNPLEGADPMAVV